MTEIAAIGACFEKFTPTPNSCPQGGGGLGVNAGESPSPLWGGVVSTQHSRPIATLAISLFVAFCLLFAFANFARAEVKIQEVVSQKGVKAWLVEDYSVPIIAIRFAFDGGSSQDPAGKEGLANLMSGLFDEGAGGLDSEAFQVRLDDAGAEMGFSEGRDALYGSMRMLADQKDEAFELLRLAVNQPRFDQAPIDRIRSQIVSGILASQRTPEAKAQEMWRKAVYGTHPYARKSDGTAETLAAIKADDLKGFHKAILARDNLHVGVVGAIDAETLKGILDKVFGDLPERAAVKPVPDVQLKLDQTIRVPYEQPETSIQMAYPGVARSDPEFFAVFLMNHVLGGGTFTSRLFDEVREKRGLVYNIDSGLATSAHSNALTISTATRSDRAAETLKVIDETVARMATDGPTETELEAAKKYVIGAYAINNLDTSGGIARTLVELQMDKLGIDYMQRRADIINAVTIEQVKTAAKRLLTAKPAVMILGPEMAGGGG
jgi:zinc protease